MHLFAELDSSVVDEIQVDMPALAVPAIAMAWGWNEEGELGDGTTIDRSTPAPVLNLKYVKAVAGGDSHALALQTDGTVWAWGRGSSGQLGDGTATQRNTPVRVHELSEVTAIAGGSAIRGCALPPPTKAAWRPAGNRRCRSARCTAVLRCSVHHQLTEQAATPCPDRRVGLKRKAWK